MLFGIAAALIFGCAGFCGIVLAMLVCARFGTLEDGPTPHPARPAAIVAGAVVLGLVLALRHTPIPELGLTALLCVPLAAIWYSDALKGVIPDVFTLGPLAIVGIYVVSHHAWWVALSALVPFVPFALAAMFSKGRGMGWGDAKLVALGGAVLGMQTGVLAFALACFAATIVSVIRDRGKSPVAFGPYLVASLAVAIAVQVHG
jgi:prepilin signal peptidase PulO-like enzyme (type II secretory pathway)